MFLSSWKCFISLQPQLLFLLIPMRRISCNGCGSSCAGQCSPLFRGNINLVSWCVPFVCVYETFVIAVLFLLSIILIFVAGFFGC